MRLPPLPHTATITSTGTPVIDPATNNQIPGPPVVVTAKCMLQQLPPGGDTADTGTAGAVADWLGIFPPGTVISTSSRVAALGYKFVVLGAPAPQETLRGVSHVEARLKYVSDLQE